MLKKIIYSSHVTLTVGIILLFTSGYEAWETWDNGAVGAHHGILVYSITQIAKVISDFKEGLRDVTEVLK